MGSLYQRGSVWWLKCRANDRIIRESSGSTKEGDAKSLLKRREGASEEGRPVIPRVEKVTVGELLDGLKAEYEANGRRSLDRLTFSLAHLRPVFGPRRAVHVTAADVTVYITARQAAKAANATINRELAALKKATRWRWPQNGSTEPHGSGCSRRTTFDRASSSATSSRQSAGSCPSTSVGS